MKRGCFIKSVIILTIIVAAILYIIENKFNDFILTPAKHIFIPALSKEIDKDIERIKPSVERDSLKIIIRDYINEINKKTSLSKDSIENVINSIKSTLEDSVVTSQELNNLKKIMEVKRTK